MKNFLTVLLGIACIIVIIIGNSNWNKQIQSIKATKDEKSTSEVSQPQPGSENKEPAGIIEKDVIALASNWPAPAIERFEQTLVENTAFKILFIGSPAIGSETSGTFHVVKQKLLEVYGEKNIQPSIKVFDTNSDELITNHYHEEIATEAADLIVIEPFTLVDNGMFVSIDDSLNNLSTLIEEIQNQNPNTTIIIQPSYPLYNAKNYPIQVEEVKEFAAKNQLTYLDHWTAWPDQKSDEMLNHLLPQQAGPSDKGIQVWSDFLLKYFISNEDESN